MTEIKDIYNIKECIDLLQHSKHIWSNTKGIQDDIARVLVSLKFIHGTK